MLFGLLDLNVHNRSNHQKKSQYQFNKPYENVVMFEWPYMKNNIWFHVSWLLSDPAMESDSYQWREAATDACLPPIPSANLCNSGRLHEQHIFRGTKRTVCGKALSNLLCWSVAGIAQCAVMICTRQQQKVTRTCTLGWKLTGIDDDSQIPQKLRCNFQ